MDECKSVRRARIGKSLQHQLLIVEASLAPSDTVIPSTCKDADGTQELKLKIYEAAGLTHGTSLRNLGFHVLFTSELVESSTGLN